MGARAEADFRRAALERHENRGSELQMRNATGRIVCRECGKPIPGARLEALPGAARCIACQTEHEEG